MDKKTAFLAQLIKEAGKIDSETKLAKMLCYIEKERGISTGFKFENTHKHGNYTFEIKDESKLLESEGLIECHAEQSVGYWGDNIKRHVFIATEKLKNFELPLTDKEKTAVRSIYSEYSRYTAKEIEEYDHAVYRDGKNRTDVELKKEFLKKTRQSIEKHKGDEIAAFKEWLFG